MFVVVHGLVLARCFKLYLSRILPKDPRPSHSLPRLLDLPKMRDNIQTINHS